jgi:YidC/Oxa1 family membrane protein insertase
MDQKNLIYAMILIAAIWGVYIAFFAPEFAAPPAPQQAAPAPGDVLPQPDAAAVPAPAEAVTLDREAALKQAPRVPIRSPRLKGSIVLKGGKLDDIVLAGYREEIDPGSPNVVLLSPAAAPDAYFAEIGWSTTAGAAVKLPDHESLWRADRNSLLPGQPLTLTWDNGEGLAFTRVFSLDENYMFTVMQRVENTGAAPVALYPYGRVRRAGTPELGFSQILQEGPIGVFGNTPEESKYILNERQYGDMRGYYEDPAYLQEGSRLRANNGCHLDNQFASTGGWLGITDKYWLVALVPDQALSFSACYRWLGSGDKDVYQVDYIGNDALTVAPGAKIESTASLFAGAKEVRLIDRYRDEFAGTGIPDFDRAVDFAGYLGLFLTWIAKPLFYLLDYIFVVVGNFGVAIMLLTVLVKAAFFWLANKSYRAMNKMKKLAPQMQQMKERYGDDKVRLNQEMMALYKREKVNPAAGCLPILVQIPVFIALYQVLYVTIEMRHAPFFGWIKDLSAPDPTSVLNLFGLLPYDIPDLGLLSILSIGIWPLLMGVTMFLQQKMNPPPPDPVQARIFMMLPIVFTFMLAPFAAGLVIYWAWNNLLSIAQQWLLKRLDERREAAKQAPATVEKPAGPKSKNKG